jgi:hypothetical protein
MIRGADSVQVTAFLRGAMEFQHFKIC